MRFPVWPLSQPASTQAICGPRGVLRQCRRSACWRVLWLGDEAHGGLWPGDVMHGHGMMADMVAFVVTWDGAVTWIVVHALCCGGMVVVETASARLEKQQQDCCRESSSSAPTE